MSKIKYIIPSTDPKCLRDLFTGIWYRQIDKRMARRCFDAGETILLHASNLRFDNDWQPPQSYNNAGCTDSFDKICLYYEIFNCDNVRGKYIHFYIELDNYLKVINTPKKSTELW